MHIINNINTPDFWDQEFTKEYRYITQQSTEGMSRWMAMKFEILSQYIPHNANILEIGCGLGHFLRFIKAKYPESSTLGVDFSPYAVEQCTAWNTPAEVSSCYDLTKYKGRFSVIVAMEIIEHISYPKKFIKHLSSLLPPNGMCILTTPIRGRLKSSHDHVQEFSIEELYAVLNPWFARVAIHDIDGVQLAICRN